MMQKRNGCPGKLHVVNNGDRNFGIQSDYHKVKGDWDDIYVDVSGFWGSYGPHVFAVAPDLASALKEARPYVEDRLHGRDGEVLGSVAKLLSTIDRLLSEAEGQQESSHG